MLDQVVAAHEALVAQRAEEALLPRVRARVAGQLVGAGELFLAVGPGARERPLPCSREIMKRQLHISQAYALRN